MKFDTLCKLVLNERDELEDNMELSADDQFGIDDTMGDETFVDDAEIGAAIELIGLSHNPDLSLTQQKELGKIAVETGIYSRVKYHKMTPEEAMDELLTSDPEAGLGDTEEVESTSGFQTKNKDELGGGGLGNDPSDDDLRNIGPAMSDYTSAMGEMD